MDQPVASHSKETDMAEDGGSRCQLPCGQEALLLSNMVSSRTVLKAFSLVVGTLAMAIGGSIYVFNTFANAMKATFNLTQPQGKHITYTIVTTYVHV